MLNAYMLLIGDDICNVHICCWYSHSSYWWWICWLV